MRNKAATILRRTLDACEAMLPKLEKEFQEQKDRIQQIKELLCKHCNGYGQLRGGPAHDDTMWCEDCDGTGLADPS